jgi:polar amino acid transport system substrate-binding protein
LDEGKRRVRLDRDHDRGCSFDIGLSGIEDGPARQSRLAVMIPYYQFREVLTVRDVDAATFRTLSDLRRHRVATLGATLAHDLLVDAQSKFEVQPVVYEDDVHPYTDLILVAWTRSCWIKERSCSCEVLMRFALRSRP